MSDNTKFKLRSDYSLPCQKGELLYLKDEYSIFFVENKHINALTSLVINTLEIMVAEEGVLSRVQGYFPILSWKNRSLPIFQSQEASIYVDDKSFNIEKNIGIGQSISKEWPIYYDENTGFIFIGKNIDQALDCVEFCTGCYLSICDGYINGLWLKPKIIESLDI